MFVLSWLDKQEAENPHLYCEYFEGRCLKMMTFQKYSDTARQSDVYPKIDRPHPDRIGRERLPVYPALALGGEAGEFSEKVKKAWRDGTQLNVVEAAKELGDILWYIDAAAKDMGFTLQQIAQMNLDKIQSRRARGVLSGSGDNR